MATPRLFIDEPLADGMSLVIGGEQARYAGRVLRCRPGDELLLFNGQGGEFRARIGTIRKQELTVEVGAHLERNVESPLDVHLLQGISRGERMDIVVQKATELGVRRITPVLCEFSVVRLDEERARKRQQHWQRIAASACEQCGRTVPPDVAVPCGLDEALAGVADDTLRLMLQPGADSSMKGMQPTAGNGIALMIGPEGGLSDREQEQANRARFRATGIGPRILRTETAAIAALVLVQARWGDLA